MPDLPEIDVSAAPRGRKLGRVIQHDLHPVPTRTFGENLPIMVAASEELGPPTVAGRFPCALDMIHDCLVPREQTPDSDDDNLA